MGNGHFFQKRSPNVWIQDSNLGLLLQIGHVGSFILSGEADESRSNPVQRNFFPFSCTTSPGTLTMIVNSSEQIKNWRWSLIQRGYRVYNLLCKHQLDRGPSLLSVAAILSVSIESANDLSCVKYPSPFTATYKLQISHNVQKSWKSTVATFQNYSEMVMLQYNQNKGSELQNS